jgi:hypothetical protein
MSAAKQTRFNYRSSLPRRVNEPSSSRAPKRDERPSHARASSDTRSSTAPRTAPKPYRHSAPPRPAGPRRRESDAGPSNSNAEPATNDKGKGPAAPRPYRFAPYDDLAAWPLARLRRELAALAALGDACDADPHLFPSGGVAAAPAPSPHATQPAIQANLRRVASAFAAVSDPRSAAAGRAAEGRLGPAAERLAALRALSDALYRAWAQATRPRACALCAEERPAARFRRATVRCGHPPRACGACLKRWAAAQLDGAGWSRLRCPECEERLWREDVKAVAGIETYERYVSSPFLSLILSPWTTPTGGSGTSASRSGRACPRRRTGSGARRPSATRGRFTRPRWARGSCAAAAATRRA